MPAWSTQTQLGKTAGMDVRQVGVWLTDLGLKAGSGVTDDAITQGLAK